MKRFFQFYNHHSFVLTSVLLGVGLAFFLARDGLAIVELAGLSAYIGGCALLFFWLRTPADKKITFDEVATFDQLLQQGGRPILIEFYSDYCAACLANRPVLDHLENEVGDRLRILRLNAREALGRALAQRYHLTYTPTFLVFNARGEKEDEFLYTLNRSRVLYWLNHQPQ